jgi:hypothetical protein
MTIPAFMGSKSGSEITYAVGPSTGVGQHVTHVNPVIARQSSRGSDTV